MSSKLSTTRSNIWIITKDNVSIKSQIYRNNDKNYGISKRNLNTKTTFSKMFSLLDSYDLFSLDGMYDMDIRY